VLLEPREGLDTRLAEIAQRLKRNGIADFHFEIADHRFDVVLDAGFLLNASAAPRVDDTATDGGRAATVEALDDQGVEPTLLGFDRRRGPRGAEADDDDVGLLVPGDRIGAIDLQWRLCRFGSLLHVDTVAHTPLLKMVVGKTAKRASTGSTRAGCNLISFGVLGSAHIFEMTSSPNRLMASTLKSNDESNLPP